MPDPTNADRSEAESEESPTERSFIKSYHHRKAIIDRQFIQKRIADMATDVYAMAATIARSDALLREHEPDVVQNAHLMCSRFIEKTWRRVRRNARRVDFETDAPLAEAIYDRGGYQIR